MGILSKTAPWDDNTYGNNRKTLRVLIECEKGSNNKYEYDDVLDRMVVVRELHPKYRYIFNCGSIPQTLAEDGDSLDAIVVGEEPIRSGTIINVIPIAVIRTIDKGQVDDKIVCTPFYRAHGTLNIKRIVKYLRKYKYPDSDSSEVIGVEDWQAAVETINEAIERFKEAGKL